MMCERVVTVTSVGLRAGLYKFRVEFITTPLTSRKRLKQETISKVLLEMLLFASVDR